MIHFLVIIVKYINTFLVKILSCFISTKRTRFFFSYLSISKNNKVSIQGSYFEYSKLFVKGKNNEILLNEAKIEKSRISIEGENNQLIFRKGVRLTNSKIFLRGQGCTIEIDEFSTIAGIRIINVGVNNRVFIGKNCLFSDNIELWASDTHSIYDENNTFINPEKPIIIGNEVWIGSHVKILKGVTIKDGAIIGMNSMVTKDIMAHTLNVGNPARCIKNNVKWKFNYQNLNYNSGLYEQK